MDYTKFCIIDDDKICQLLLKAHIKKLDIKTNHNIFSSGEEAYNFFMCNINKNIMLPDIILLDLNMPIMNGWDFLNEYKENIFPKLNKSIRIFIITSSLDDNDIRKANSSNLISGFISKPILS